MTTLPPKRIARLAPSAVQVQICERRLVLSAQLLFDVLGDQALQMHGSLDQQLSVGSDANDTAIENHTTAAHNLSGWTQMHQQFGLTGKGQTVAVIDSGIAWDHVALGRGFGAGYRVVGGWDFTEENDANPYDDGPAGYHGTHVAGIIGSDDPTRSGVAPDVDLVALRVFNDLGKGNMSWVEKALQWVHTNRNSFENPITTVNLSLGSTWNASTAPDWAILEDDLKLLHDDGILVTASAGNAFKTYNAPGLSYPASSSWVLPVASVDDDGQLSDFSQRDDRVLAAPGRNITSTVPDHLLGRDGRVNDFSTATGTSMAAPYVAGASVLVRQAMEMAGWNNITPDSIADHLRNTADTVFDSITRASYDRLDLQQAIDAIIPDDNVGDTLSTAQRFELSAGRLDGWINSLQDEDVFRFTANASGRLQFDADSNWLDSLGWSITSGGQTIDSGALSAKSISLISGQSYEIRVGADDEIGTYRLSWNFQANANDGSGENGGTTTPTQLGSVDYWQKTVQSGGSFRAQATQDGTFTVQWNNADAPQGQMSLTPVGGTTVVDSTWESGMLRLDVQAKAGQWFDIRLPGISSDQGELSIANVLLQSGKQLHFDGTANQDYVSVNLQNGLSLSIGNVNYNFAAGQIDSVEMDAGGSADRLVIVGSAQADELQLNPGLAKLSNAQLIMRAVGFEEIEFNGNGGADSAILYDSAGDDTLTLRPFQATMVGAGYKFSVTDTDRIFIHATSGGVDVGYVYDSANDDRLTVRPQFSSMSGAGYFNYISGVERLYAYGTAGGYDIADIYDSSGNDRFVTSGESASITGPGFASFTKFFEKVNAYATAGGNDSASLYGSSQATQWFRGADFVSFGESPWVREARGFEAVDTFVAGQIHSLSAFQLNVASLNAQALAAVGEADVESIAVVSPVDPVAANESLVKATDGQASSFELAFPTVDLRGGGWNIAASRSLGMHADGHMFENLHQLESFVADALSNDITNELTEGPAGRSAHGVEVESLLLDELSDTQAWMADQLELPEERLMTDRLLERKLLDQIFSLHDEDSLF